MAEPGFPPPEKNKKTEELEKEEQDAFTARIEALHAGKEPLDWDLSKTESAAIDLDLSEKQTEAEMIGKIAEMEAEKADAKNAPLPQGMRRRTRGRKAAPPEDDKLLELFKAKKEG